jgi:hypothetical protein
MSTEETLPTEVEARRAAAERGASRRMDAIARFLAAYDYADRKLKERDGDDEARRERPES